MQPFNRNDRGQGFGEEGTAGRLRVSLRGAVRMDLGWAYELDYAKVSQARLTAERLAEQLNLQAHWENFRKSFRGFLKNRAEFQA